MNKSLVKQLTRLALILVLVSVSCSLPLLATTAPTTGGPQVVSQRIITADPNSTATATPFQPVGPTATSLDATATPQPTSTVNPLDEITENIGLPTPIRIGQQMPEGMVNLLLLGSDFRPSSGYRTDVIMLVSINTQKGTVSVTSFPRDLYVYIPGWMTQRINTAQAHGGFSMMQDTFEFNFGVRPKYYVMTNFQGFINIIDSLGGINVNVGTALSDTCDLPWRSYNGYCSVSPGPMNMDGATALWYVRSRHSTSDFERTHRAQEVILALFSRLMSLDAVTRLPELYNSYRSSVETNMELQDIAPLVPLASQVLANPGLISRYAVGREHVTPYTTESGAAVLLPNYEAIMSLLQQAIFGQ
jgi:polyisoprenyl-teichoic acid--peptidoglycan teichoic acid transferase